ncbi:MAG: glycosyl transferase family 1 [Rhodospirillales bacterium]|nr:glycosyl transferase family 1 [Acetobacter sp.]
MSLANAVLLNREADIPPPSALWPYEDSEAARERNRVGWDRLLAAFAPLLASVNEQRQRWQLPPYQDFFEDSFSKLAQISQQPASFDFPRKQPPATLHFVGHLHDDELTRAVPFPWERLDGTKPLIYASLGTLQNRLEWVYRAIIEACDGLEAQVVLALGSTGFSPEQFEPIPSNMLILPYVPQADVLQRGTLCITHAGLNTSLECLEAGVPTVCLPITSEQPGVAMRMQFLGAGSVVALAELSAQTLRAAVEEVLQNPSYREAARSFAAAQIGADPRTAACDAIAEVLANLPIQTKVSSGMG